MSHDRYRFVFIGLSLSSSWGNGHATTYRALLRQLALRGHEVIWEPDTGVDGATSKVESFDSGTPVVPTVELLERKSTAPDE